MNVELSESSSCIDLVFSSNVNPINNFGVDRNFMKYITTMPSMKL